MTRVIRSYVAPNPKEFDYWVDLTSDPKGNVIRYYAGESTWLPLNDDTNTDQSKEIAALKTRVSALETKTATIESDIDSVESTVNTLDTNVDTLTSSVNTINTTVSDLTTDVKHMLVKTSIEFDAIETKDNNTLYLITEEDA